MEVSQVEIVSNDLSTVFPAIRLRRQDGRAVGEILSEVLDVAASSRHRFTIAMPAITFLEDEDILVEVVLPPTTGIDQIRSGAGLGAIHLGDSPATSFIGNTSDGELQPIDADLCVAFVGSASAGKAGQIPAPPESSEKGISLLVRTRPAGDIVVHVTSASSILTSVEIYDVRGSLVRTLAQRPLEGHEQSLCGDRRDGSPSFVRGLLRVCARGRYKREYAKGTLREKLFGAGRARVNEQHPAARYRVKPRAAAAE